MLNLQTLCYLLGNCETGKLANLSILILINIFKISFGCYPLFNYFLALSFKTLQKLFLSKMPKLESLSNPLPKSQIKSMGIKQWYFFFTASCSAITFYIWCMILVHFKHILIHRWFKFLGGWPVNLWTKPLLRPDWLNCAQWSTKSGKLCTVCRVLLSLVQTGPRKVHSYNS
jgi:hypothetical protein